jgi:hypothetical protein
MDADPDLNPQPDELGATLKVGFKFNKLPRDAPLPVSRLSTTVSTPDKNCTVVQFASATYTTEHDGVPPISRKRERGPGPIVSRSIH